MVVGDAISTWPVGTLLEVLVWSMSGMAGFNGPLDSLAGDVAVALISLLEPLGDRFLDFLGAGVELLSISVLADELFVCARSRFPLGNESAGCTSACLAF